MKISLKTRRIGCVLASVHAGSSLNLWPSMAAEAKSTGEAFFIFPGGILDFQNESEFLRNSIYKLVNTENLDGFISWGSAIGGVVSYEELNKFHESKEPLPYVTIAYKMPNHRCVSFDAYTGMKQLVLHLIKEHGAKRIAFLRGPLTHISACERYKAFLDAIEQENLYTDDYMKLVSDPFPWSEGEKAAVQLFETRRLVPGRDYDTLVASSDMMLFSAATYLQSYGFRIPQDIRVAAFNDSTESRIFSTPFSTVHMPYEELGVAAHRMICELLDKPDCAAADKILPTQLVIRESCGCNKLISLRSEPAAAYAPEKTREIKKKLLDDLSALFDAGDVVISSVISPLLDALENSETENFISLLAPALNRFFADGSDVSLLFEGIMLVHRSGFLPTEYFDFAANLIYKQIVQAQSSSFALKQYENEKCYSVMNSLKCALLSVHDRTALVKVLQKHLPLAGIHTAAVVLYEDDEYSRFAGGFSADADKAAVYEASCSELFPAKRLFPPQFEDDYASGVFLVQPLFTENQPLGYLLTNAAFYDGSVYEDLRSAVSNALHGIFLFEQMLVSKQTAERAEHAKTEFFSNIGVDLSDPLKNVMAKITQMERNLQSGIADPEILGEQLLFLKAQIGEQLEKTNMLVDLTLLQADDIALEKKMCALADMLPETAGFPLVYADPARIEKAFNLIKEDYNGGVSAALRSDGIHLVFRSGSRFPVGGVKPSLLLAEKIIALHFGDFIAEKEVCHVVLPYPNLAGLAPVRGAKLPEKIISFSPELADFGSIKLPVIQKAPANYSEFPEADASSPLLLAWNYDNASVKDIINMYSLRYHSGLFRMPMLFFSKNGADASLLDMLEAAVRAKKDAPVLFIDDAQNINYGRWVREENAVVIKSLDDFDAAVSTVMPVLIVLKKIDLSAVRFIRRRPGMVLVPVLILPDAISNSPETEELCSLPRVLLCNRGVAGAPQFIDRVKSIIAGSEILPPHTGALVKKAIIYLNEHVSSQIVRWKLADSVHVSEDYLTRIFHKETGLSLWEYLNRYRIFLATNLLLNTNGTIYEIAEQTGFQDQAYFCRVFKKIHGVPPGKIRNKIDFRTE
ncbi:MAG: substrate-binding domain-containing protein [Bacteroides sp.]|nr:substrate-binding domain-containing protein [Prevotella sp.]MCM1407191.1 substrate-binding domain-containing protein [Treponema brennaborense]MCM1470343.1 substrate-binding domain-containing protein [Bacteroides sp.]